MTRGCAEASPILVAVDAEPHRAANASPDITHLYLPTIIDVLDWAQNYSVWSFFPKFIRRRPLVILNGAPWVFATPAGAAQ